MSWSRLITAWLTQTAKIFTTGDVILSRRPDSWESFFALDAAAAVPTDFMTEADRNQGEHGRDPFEDKAA